MRQPQIGKLTLLFAFALAITSCAEAQVTSKKIDADVSRSDSCHFITGLVEQFEREISIENRQSNYKKIFEASRENGVFLEFSTEPSLEGEFDFFCEGELMGRFYIDPKFINPILGY